VDLKPFSPEMQLELDKLRMLVTQEDAAFAIRGKFPHHIKPILQQVALKAIVLDEYDENFFNAMPGIFPYNKFTMTKLTKRLVFPLHAELLTNRQDELLVELKALVDDGFERAKEEYERSLTSWENKQEKKKAERAAENAGSNGAHPSQSARSSVVDGDVMDVDAPSPGSTLNGQAPPKSSKGKDKDTDKDKEGGEGEAADAKPEREDKPPQRKYKLTEAMRAILWNLVSLTNEVAKLTNEKNQLENSAEQVSDQGMRKILYQRIQNCFPDGWMTTGILSREVSSLKKKHGREAMADLDVD